jgi:hypothetical protein
VGGHDNGFVPFLVKGSWLLLEQKQFRRQSDGSGLSVNASKDANSRANEPQGISFANERRNFNFAEIWIF